MLASPLPLIRIHLYLRLGTMLKMVEKTNRTEKFILAGVLCLRLDFYGN